MKEIYYLPLCGVLMLLLNDCSGQISKKEWETYYKQEFFYFCSQPFVIDTGWRDDVCRWTVTSLDKKSYLEIDSLSSIVEELIWNDFDKTTGLPRYVNGPYPGRDCANKFCLEKYDSKDLQKLAKKAAKRINKMTPEEIFMSHR